jgi:hypothetical protein
MDGPNRALCALPRPTEKSCDTPIKSAGRIGQIIHA